MPTVLPHPETLFLRTSEQVSKPVAAERSAPTVADKINRLRQKRELAAQMQAMILNSGLTIDDLRDALK